MTTATTSLASQPLKQAGLITYAQRADKMQDGMDPSANLLGATHTKDPLAPQKKVKFFNRNTLVPFQTSGGAFAALIAMISKRPAPGSAKYARTSLS